MLVRRAEKSGYKVIALTVDGPVPGMDNLRPKERDIRNAFVTPPNTERVNLIGEIIFSENLENFEGEYTHSFNLSEYSKGVYLLELDTDNGIVNKKLILQ